jgi:hypothetical protein
VTKLILLNSRRTPLSALYGTVAPEPTTIRREGKKGDRRATTIDRARDRRGSIARRSTSSPGDWANLRPTDGPVDSFSILPPSRLLGRRLFGTRSYRESSFSFVSVRVAPISLETRTSRRRRAVHLSTSGQASLPGEFKHINDRRKRN